MDYIEQQLSAGEQILYVARQHVFVLITNILAELSLISLLVAAGVASHMAFDTSSVVIGELTASNLILLICVGISVIVLISGFIDYLRWINDQYIITDRRVIQVRGVITKRAVASSLEKINDVELRQSIIGRMMNFGTVAILTASGEESNNTMDRIADPVQFKRVMLDAKHNHERGYGYLPEHDYAPQPLPPATRASIVDELTRLADLRDRGILSPEEFESQKRHILSRMR
ncbi:PH domain-containing protein [Candidatus Viridilinea mediisalina]|uniref:DUF304 domain-containing protein n=1 Tax=Candidatus Viridilinea mediisalina TaxID=2024553 RepID=A0A2A6RP31_9CHLR|nr:PH domain-containing protein [Candidatus Viridilinea mediisalina]PDW04807.1 hypothetical protein CJ255_01830 [Candidatus Viridilinea mediisalina]